MHRYLSAVKSHIQCQTITNATSIHCCGRGQEKDIDHGNATGKLTRSCLCWVMALPPLGMDVVDPELWTRNREPDLQFHAQQNSTYERELSAWFWKKEVDLSCYWFGVKRIYLYLLGWEAKCCICTKNRRLAGSSDGITTSDGNKNLWESGGEQLLSCTFFLTRNYYMEWYSLPTDSNCLHLLIMPCFSLIGDSLTVFQSTLFSCLTGFTLAYTNISLKTGSSILKWGLAAYRRCQML